MTRSSVGSTRGDRRSLRAPGVLWALWACALGVAGGVGGAGCAGCTGCKDKPAALAELVQISGSTEAIERTSGDDTWRRANLGDKLFLGDAIRTKDCEAQLRLGDASRLEMERHTVVRFGRRGDSAREQQLLVEDGAVELVGSGAYQLDIGEISVARNGGVRITAGDDGSRVELLVGQASIRTAGGQVQDLARGVALELSDIEVRPLAPEAAVDANVDAPVDAGVPPPDAPAPVPTVAVTSTGKGAEVRTGEGKWRPLRAGEALEPGATVRARGATKLDNGEVTLALERGGVATVGEGRALGLSAGDAEAQSAPGATGQVALPGGSLALDAHASGSRTELSVGRRGAKVRVTKGAATLTGSGEPLQLRRGESASLAASGAVRTIVAAPRSFDLSLSAGESATLHDGRGSAAVQLRFGEACAGEGVVELAASAQFRSPVVSSGRGAANLLVSGAQHYRVRCETAAGDSRPVASGRISVVRDSGRRALPAAPPPFPLAVDGRTYRVGYQGAIPAMVVEWKGATGRGYVLHLASGGKAQTFPASGPVATIPGHKLRDGAFTLWFEKGGQRSKVSSLIIDFDNTAPQVYVDEPDDGEAWGAEVVIKGAVLPDWAVSVDGVSLPLDRQRRFSASVPAPSTGVLAIKLSHPQRGVHYYLRRRK